MVEAFWTRLTWESKHPDYVNYTNLANDAAAAYQLALRWKLSDEAEYGDAAKTILNAWAKNCKGIYRENGSLIDPNELLIAIQVISTCQCCRDFERVR